MRTKSILIAVAIFLSLMFTAKLFAHCEIPCGIYDDEMRYDMLSEHIKTMEKSMKYINNLSKHKNKNYNQLIRWTNNKEMHANEFQDIVSQYFLTQRIKPDTKDKNYLKHLALFHEMLVYAMKCKQTTDLKNASKLKDLVAESRKLYFKK